ncbi:hypothetical protein HNO88_002775 [Novosphingobium chloroacetimidivorans]|uniref:Uncharacterized protein n=1 Tax=Novosphingobium chloroacetimidivorans TaxID=1428314 RepID=A0A7W7NWL0_9SPHN|nr:hypothetical protein [Novosphingobium chloroacetimidivorans]MBB4859446.1 hypothetical protein [Novosphingobium chloroacetimidivorans]
MKNGHVAPVETLYHMERAEAFEDGYYQCVGIMPNSGVGRLLTMLDRALADGLDEEIGKLVLLGGFARAGLAEKLAAQFDGIDDVWLPACVKKQAHEHRAHLCHLG